MNNNIERKHLTFSLVTITIIKLHWEVGMNLYEERKSIR